VFSPTQSFAKVREIVSSSRNLTDEQTATCVLDSDWIIMNIVSAFDDAVKAFCFKTAQPWESRDEKLCILVRDGQYHTVFSSPQRKTLPDIRPSSI